MYKKARLVQKSNKKILHTLLCCFKRAGLQAGGDGGGEEEWWEEIKGSYFSIQHHHTGRSDTSSGPGLIWSCSHCPNRTKTLNGLPLHLFPPLVAVTFFYFEISAVSNLLLSFLLLHPLILSSQCLHFYFYTQSFSCSIHLAPQRDLHSSIPKSSFETLQLSLWQQRWLSPQCGAVNSKHSERG